MTHTNSMTYTEQTNRFIPHKRVAIFASYNKENKISKYVIYYLTELKKVVDSIIFVSDNFIDETELKKIEHLVVHTSCYRHKSYDFGSYRIGFLWALKHGLLKNADELIFLNDSCYGPVFPFKEVFTTMSEKNCDFWGLVESYEPVHHILSFFMVFKKNVFNSNTFISFVTSFKQLDNFWDYVNKYERSFTLILERARFKSAVFIKATPDLILQCAYQSGNGNTTTFPMILFEKRMPLIKVKAMNGSFGYDLHESPQILLQNIEKTNKTLYNIIIDDLASKGIKPEDRWLTPKEIIQDAEIVSFDVFDTLLARPFARPTDLFLHMEKELGVPNFRKERVLAEAKARKAHPKQADITLKQIYEKIDLRFKHLLDQELNYERELLFAKTDGKNIYEEAVRSGKKIIAISDMYLPKTFIKEVLVKNGYTDISEIFVSNEENACKHGGKLFEIVLQKLNVSPVSIVHIGDNAVSDKSAAEKVGIRSCLRPSDLEAMRNTPALARLKKLSDKKDLCSSILSGIFSYHKATHKNANPFREFGYELGGPFAVGYALHIHKVATERGIDGILFVSRDGYAIYEIYKRLFPNSIPGYYIQASRKLLLRNDYKYPEQEYCENVYNTFSEECLDGRKILQKEYKKYSREIKEWTEKNARLYETYLDSLNITGNKLMTVDMTTRAYTSLKLITKVFGDRIDCGMFSITYGEPCPFTVLNYSEKHWTAGEEALLMLEEELITAPECSAYKLNEDGTFSRTDWNPIERQRVENYNTILAGIIDFAKDYIHLSNKHYIPINYNVWETMAKDYINHRNYGTEELFKNIFHEYSLTNDFDNLYSLFFQPNGIDSQNNNGDEYNNYSKLLMLQNKRKKYLKVIRKFAIIMGIETIVIAMLLAWLFFL